MGLQEFSNLLRILRGYLAYYHSRRTHLPLEKDSPEPRKVESPDQGRSVRVDPSHVR